MQRQIQKQHQHGNHEQVDTHAAEQQAAAEEARRLAAATRVKELVERIDEAADIQLAQIEEVLSTQAA